MFSIAKVSSAATQFIGIAFCSVAAVAIVAPQAHAAAPASFQSRVEASIDNTMQFPAHVSNDVRGVATVAVLIDAKGNVRSADIVKSSGNGALDREAVRTARAVSYPATGANRTVAMVLAFNQPAPRAAQDESRKLANAYRDDHRQLLATETTAQPVG